MALLTGATVEVRTSSTGDVVHLDAFCPIGRRLKQAVTEQRLLTDIDRTEVCRSCLGTKFAHEVQAVIAAGAGIDRLDRLLSELRGRDADGTSWGETARFDACIVQLAAIEALFAGPTVSACCAIDQLEQRRAELAFAGTDLADNHDDIRATRTAMAASVAAGQLHKQTQTGKGRWRSSADVGLRSFAEADGAGGTLRETYFDLVADLLAGGARPGEVIRQVINDHLEASTSMVLASARYRTGTPSAQDIAEAAEMTAITTNYIDRLATYATAVGPRSHLVAVRCDWRTKFDEHVVGMHRVATGSTFDLCRVDDLTHRYLLVSDPIAVRVADSFTHSHQRFLDAIEPVLNEVCWSIDALRVSGFDNAQQDWSQYRWYLADDARLRQVVAASL